MITQLNHVTKRFGDTQAIRDLSLELPTSGIVAIMGPSGCGKTTILQLLAGLLQPTSGTIRCSAQSIAYVFQEPRLLPWRTVADNIRLSRADFKIPPQHTVEAWLEAVGLADCADKYPDELSGGMRQRVSIARALYCGSELLLMDEPFQGLDHEIKARIMETVRHSRMDDRMLTLLVTHHMDEAQEIADLILTFDSSPASAFTVQPNKPRIQI